MAHKPTVYSIPTVPDPDSDRLFRTTGGKGRERLVDAMEHMLRVLAGMPAESCSFALRFCYRPNGQACDLRRRLSVDLRVNARSPEWRSAISHLVENGPAADLVGLVHNRVTQRLPWTTLRSACHIRHQCYLRKPMVAPDRNPDVPEMYFVQHPFVPNLRNDWMTLDGVLAGLNECVVIDVAFSPANVAGESAALAQYAAALQRAGSPWSVKHDMGSLGYEGYATGEPGITKIDPLQEPDALARDVLRRVRALEEGICVPQLAFHVLVLAERESTARLVGAVVADSAFRGGSYALATHSNQRTIRGYRSPIEKGFVLLAEQQTHVFGERWRSAPVQFLRLPHLATVDELLGIFRIPVVSGHSPLCIKSETDPEPMNYASSIVLGCSDSSAVSASDSITPLLGLPVQDLTKHMFVGGVSGSGKSTVIFHLLTELQRHGITFTVFETAKKEYRSILRLRESAVPHLKALGNELMIFSPDNDLVSPLRINPLQRLPGISMDELIGELLNGFKASIPLSGPLPSLLADALEDVLLRAADFVTAPVLHDLVDAVFEILEAMGYSSETSSDIRAALDVRLRMLTKHSMGRVFQCPVNVPGMDLLMERTSIIEMDRLCGDHKALLALIMLATMRQYLRTHPASVTGLRHVVVIEEAHNIVGTRESTTPSESNADPRAFAAQFVCQMLAELRSMGVGIIVVDQSPSAVAPSVIRNTSTKVVLRTVDQADRQALGATMLFDHRDEEDIARLQVGQAFLFCEGYHGPQRMRTHNLHAEADLSPLLDNDALELLQGTSWFNEMRRVRTDAELNSLMVAANQFDDSRMHATRVFSQHIASFMKTLRLPPSAGRMAAFDGLENRANTARMRLEKSWKTFKRQQYEKLMPAEGVVSDHPLAAALAHRVESCVKPDMEALMTRMQQFEERCVNAAAELEAT